MRQSDLTAAAFTTAKLIAISLVTLAFVASSARAAEIVYLIEGTVLAPATTYSPTVSPGDPVVLRIVLEDGLPDANQRNPRSGFYPGSLLLASATAGEWSGTSVGVGNLSVSNDIGGSNPTDSALLVVPMMGPAFATPVFNLVLDFKDSVLALATSGDEFPTLTNFPLNQASGRISFSPPGERITFSLQAVTIVPEPATGLLVGLGLALLGRLRR